MDDDISATFNYINPKYAPANPDTTLFVALGDETAPRDLFVGKEKKVHNARNYNFTLENDGFELLSNVRNPVDRSHYDNKRDRYYLCKGYFGPLAIRLVQERFGVTPFAWHFVPPFIRKSGGDTNDQDHSRASQPHAMVHNDYSQDYHQILQTMGPKEMGTRDMRKARQVADDFHAANRVIVLQFWICAQPEGTCVENDSLAFCHPRSVHVSDLVKRNLATYDGKPTPQAILQAKDSGRHEWFYWPKLKAGEECLCWIGHDTDDPKPCFHSSFHDGKGGTRPRESLECRVILLFDSKVPSRL
jgi:hypothetical protein